MIAAQQTPEAVLAFWFDEATPQQWFARSDDFDRLIARRFGAVHAAAARCELYGWRATAGGRLAEVIVLDQFSRNIHRDTPRAFAQDALALVLAQELVATGRQAELPLAQRRFVYMPYMHSESLAVHDQALRLFAEAGLEDALRYNDLSELEQHYVKASQAAVAAVEHECARPGQYRIAWRK